MSQESSLRARLRDRIGLLLALWLAAFAPRLTLAILFANYPITLSDMLQYDMLARSLAQGNGYCWYSQADLQRFAPYLSLVLDLSRVQTTERGIQTSFRAPGYPLALAALYGLVPEDWRIPAARLTQAALSALMAPLTALLALRIGLSRRTAKLAGIGMATYPVLIFYPLGIVSENLYIPLVLITVLALLRAAGSQRLVWAVTAGVLLGVAILTRSILVSFAVFAGVWLGRCSRLGGRAAAVVLAVALGLCLPWALRNSLLAGRPTFVETSLGYNLYVGYHPEGNGDFDTGIALAPLAIADDAERDRYATAAALSFIRQDPLEAVSRIARRAAFFVGPEDRELTFFYSANFFGEIRRPWLTILYISLIAPWLATALLAIAGAMILPDGRSAWLVAALVAGYGLPHLLILAEPRFHLALAPVLLPLAAHAVVEWRRAAAAVSTRAGGPWAWAARGGIAALLALWVWGFAMRCNVIIATLGPGGHLLYRPY